MSLAWAYAQPTLVFFLAKSGFGKIYFYIFFLIVFLIILISSESSF